jgi:hypothetical protein
VKTPQDAGLLYEADIVEASVPLGQIKRGIYFLIQDGRVIYVGQSIRIHVRLINA